eukprot:Hpha_TRINITY_DN34209_c0_g1::TRINITY_DN34209_c0_g1_i1::g.34453::m.34453
MLLLFVLCVPATSSPTGCGATEIAAGGLHSCARRSDDGQMRCWGQNDYGQLGVDDTHQRGDAPGEMGSDLPPVILSVDNFTTGPQHSCGLRRSDGSLVCWGRGEVGNLGTGSTSNKGGSPGDMASLTPVPVPSACSVVQIMVGYYYNCVLCTNRAQAYCWGWNNVGQLGLGDTQ